jgi:HPt (histidine-containing phosphotransfer) domain-containing protein
MGTSLIDKGTFDSLKEMTGADYLPVLIDAYFEDADILFAEMHSALAAGDAVRVGRAGHSLKGNSANFGATALTALARELEFLGKEGNLAGCGPKIEEVAAAYKQVKQELEAMRNGL